MAALKPYLNNQRPSLNDLSIYPVGFYYLKEEKNKDYLTFYIEGDGDCKLQTNEVDKNRSIIHITLKKEQEDCKGYAEFIEVIEFKKLSHQDISIEIVGTNEKISSFSILNTQ